MSFLDAGSMERIVPDEIAPEDFEGSQSLRLHIERYDFAASLIPSSSKVMDLACGVGYGSRIIRNKVREAQVTGVDCSRSAIEYAKGRYLVDRLRFVVSNAMDLDAECDYDVVVSLETLEHLPSPREYLGRTVRGVLRPGGLFIGSVPVTPSVDANPHHLHDFTPNSFRKLLGQSGLVEFAALEQNQPFSPFGLAPSTVRRARGVRPRLLRYYLEHPRSAMLRLKSTMLHGFVNKYLTIAARFD